MTDERIDELRMVFPKPEHKRAALIYKQEYTDAGEAHINGSGSFMQARDYESWLDKVTSARIVAPPEWVKYSTYFAFSGDKIVGTIQIRHTLNDYLIKTAGHIGYGVAPSERRKGYATKMLSFALNRCHALGIERVLVTCNKDNTASAKTILRGGGVYEKEIMDNDGNIVQRYWIEVQ